MNRRTSKTSVRKKPTASKTKRAPKKQQLPVTASKILVYLSAEDGVATLRALANQRPELIPEIERIVFERVESIEFENVATEVVEAFSELTMFDLAPPSDAFHYEGESESVWRVLTETVEPFVEEIHRLVKMGLVAAALTYCEGTLLGLYRADREHVYEFHDWAPDAVPEIAGEALRALSPIRRRRLPGGKVTAGKALKEFAREHLGEWAWVQE